MTKTSIYLNGNGGTYAQTDIGDGSSGRGTLLLGTSGKVIDHGDMWVWIGGSDVHYLHSEEAALMKVDKPVHEDKRIHCPECGSVMLLPSNVSIMGRNAECLECGLEFAVKLNALPVPDEEDFKDD